MLENLGPYRIDRLLGRGGMGSVYAGTHQDTGELAAIKVLSTVLADDGNFRSRFVAEIDTLKKLDHPRIVRLSGYGEEDGHLFYVMELVDGHSLQEMLQNGARFSWQEVIDMAIQVCGALKHAHDRGVIHRDLKPANLILKDDGAVMLTDFGVAKLFGASQLTAAGSVVGTADYMAPEQAEGKTVSERTDLYSLGSLMFTLLGRRPPFTASSVAQVIHKLRFSQPPSIRRYAPQVPIELEQLIAQLLAKEPQDRLPTALVLSKRLQAIKTAGVNPSSPDADPFLDTPTLASESPSTDDATAVDNGPASHEPGAYSWNQATVNTAESQPPADDDGDGEYKFASQETVADDELALPVNRFTTIEEELQQREKSRPGVSQKVAGHLQTILLSIALLAVIGAATWLAWPPSADQLYQRIASAVESAGPEEAKPSIDQFLERFPADPRSEEVRGWHRDVECDWLQSRLALRELKSGGSKLTPYEKQWLAAMRLKLTDPVAARTALEELHQQYADATGQDAALQAVLDATQHQLVRLEGS